MDEIVVERESSSTVSGLTEDRRRETRPEREDAIADGKGVHSANERHTSGENLHPVFGLVKRVRNTGGH